MSTAAYQTGTGGDSLQQFTQYGAFVGRQRRGDRLFEPAGHLIEVGQQAAGALGERYRERAPIGWMRHARDQLGGLQGVDEGHHDVAMNAESRCELPL